MSVFAQRRLRASHFRTVVTPDVGTTWLFLGRIRIGAPNEGDAVDQSLEMESSPTAEFEVIVRPKDDLRVGDQLYFSGYIHRVARVRRYDSGKRVNYAEADVQRREVPEFQIGTLGGDEMMQTGIFTGDGTDARTITTGLTGVIRSVRVWRKNASTSAIQDAAAKVSDMPDDVAYPSVAGSGKGVTFSGADFIVDATSLLNVSGETNYWQAFSTPS